MSNTRTFSKTNHLLAALALLVAAVALALAPAAPAAQDSSTDQARSAPQNWFGGVVYDGDPDLELTAALVEAGGGADNFSFARALVSMLGEDTVNAEVDKLQEQYDQERVQGFIEGMTWAVNDGLKRATEAGVELPDAPEDLTGQTLAKALVEAGTTPDGTFWSGYLFDKTLSHGIHNQVMADIEAEFGHDADESTHLILNQAMYDVAQALGMTDVALADLH